MKKILILLLVFIATLWAEIKIEMAIQIDALPEELFEGVDNMEEDPEVCSAFFEKKPHDEYGYLTCDYAGLCKTMLDSNILFGWKEGFFYSGGSIEFYFFTGETHSVKEILEDEFIRYKSCYGFTKNDSIFNLLFTRIDSVLIPKIDQYLQNETKKSPFFVYDYAMGAVRPAELAIPGGGCDLCLIGIASDTVKARNAAISSIAPAKYKLEAIRVQNHRLTASPKLLGREFTLFDVNGHELRRGTLQNNMRLPAYPTVIKIQGFGTRLLNSR
jgi:hypothetical protein